MHRPRRSFHDLPKKPSKLLAVLALLIACLLPYLVIKTFFGKKHHESLVFSEGTTIQSKTGSAPEKASKPVVKMRLEKTVTRVENTKPISSLVNVTTRSGDSLATIFKRAGISAQTLHAVLNHNKHAALLTRIKPNQSMQLSIKKNQLEHLTFQLDHGQRLDVSLQKGHYTTTLTSPKTEYRERYVTAIVQYSLYGTAKRQNIPYKLIQQMTDIFKREINFAKDVRSGDRFTIIYKAGYMGSDLVSVGEIIAVTYTHRGESHQALRHVNAAGEVDYFTPQGESMKQGFSRYPVKFSHINSAFSLSRMHPILHYHRPHNGVDLAAPMGTPIFATGDGKVQQLGYENGYGNVIKISHHNALYTSVYAHLLKFKKGLFRGSYVKRGEVIGYVGKSGLASGPHCHYEFHVNHRPKNPSTVSLPQAEPIARRDLAAFKAHADKLVEHLKLFEEAHLTSTKDHAVG